MTNCNLELQLLPPSASFSSSDSNQYYLPQMQNNSRSQQQEQQQPQTLTIFYNGRVRVCDVTEHQARSILMMATREIEGMKTKSQPASPSIQYQLCSSGHPTPGQSMKRSLQRFLQKRKNRIQATSPYHH